MQKRILYILFLLCGFSMQAQDSIPLITIHGNPTSVEIRPGVQVWRDSTGQMDLNAVEEAQLNFIPLDSLEMPLPIHEHLWARLALFNASPDTLSFVLITGQTDITTVYTLHKTKIDTALTGNYVPPTERSIQRGETHAVGIRLFPGDTTRIFIHMEERVVRGPLLKPTLESQTAYYYRFYANNFNSGLFLFFFLGAVLMIMLYNLVVFFSSRETLYGYYALYLFSLAMTIHFEPVVRMLPELGFTNPWGNGVAALIFLNGNSIFYLLFGREFVNLKDRFPFWHKVFLGLISIRIILILGGLIVEFMTDISTDLGSYTVGLFGIEGLVLLPFLFLLLRNGQITDRYFVAGSILVFGFGFFSIFLSNMLDLPYDNTFIVTGALLLEILVFSLGLGYRMRLRQKEKLEAEQALNSELSKVNSAFGRFVPHEFLKSLGHTSVLDVQLGDQVEKEVSVLFADIRGYTTLAENMSPAENFKFLNAYLGRVGPVIQRHGGFVNQYYGDGVMALFIHEDHQQQALEAGEEIQEVLIAYNAERTAKGRGSIRMGIGIHTGPLMMGIIGDTLRMEAGVVSDTVNTAARMEGLTKHFGTHIILSETVFKSLGPVEQEKLRYLGRVLVKGRRQPTDIYASTVGFEPDIRQRLSATAEMFKSALTAYHAADFAGSLALLDQVLEQHPSDTAAQYYHQCAERYLLEGKPEGWQGVEMMMQK